MLSLQNPRWFFPVGIFYLEKMILLKKMAIFNPSKNSYHERA